MDSRRLRRMRLCNRTGPPRPSARVARRKQEGHRSALGETHDGCPVRSGGVHHGTDVVHARLEVGNPRSTIGEAGPALVEQDQSRERSQLAEEVCGRALPGILQGREHPAVHEHEVERPVADHRIRDIGFSALRKPNVGSVHDRRVCRRHAVLQAATTTRMELRDLSHEPDVYSAGAASRVTLAVRSNALARRAERYSGAAANAGSRAR